MSALEHHTVYSGRMDRGSPQSPFEAVSQKADGTYVRTRHQTEAKARKALAGRTSHENKRLIDHRPPEDRKAAAPQQ